jgi:hypothetical protein
MPMMAGAWEEYYIPEPNSGCWLWDAGVGNDGYGKVKRGGVTYRAHKYAWMQEHGPVPDGLLVCHSCDVITCVNPAHLFLGTQKENLEDMVRKGRKVRPFDAFDYCINGHELTSDNIYTVPSSGKRQCRMCRHEADLRRQ